MSSRPRFLLAIASAAAMFFIPSAALAATYYVDPSGNDGNAGTQASPWKTPQKAASTAVAGDVVNFNQGTYNITASITIANSGTAANWISFRATPGHERLAVIDGTGLPSSENSKGAWHAIGKSYIILEGLKVQNIVQGSGIQFLARGSQSETTTATGIRIRNCHTYITKNPGIYIAGIIFNQDTNDSAKDIMTDVIVEDCRIEKACTSNANESISAGSGVKNIIVRNNEILDSIQYGVDFKKGLNDGSIYGNVIYGMEGPGIYIDAATRYVRNVHIYNNRVHSNSGSSGIVLRRENWGGVTGSYPDLSDVYVYNNLVYNCGRDGIALDKHPQDTTPGTLKNISIVNNTVYNVGTEAGHSGAGLRVTHSGVTGVNVRVRNNITWNIDGTNGTFSAWVTTSNNLLGTADPLFTNAGQGDFHLQSGSPAIDAGTSTDAPATDFEGNSRPQGSGFDQGAYERLTGPAAPSSLTATAISSSQINLGWSDNSSNETQFRIERKVGTGSFAFLINKAANSTSHGDTGLTANTSYTYRVRAENGTGSSPWSNEASATTLSGGSAPTLHAPRATYATSTASTSHTISLTPLGLQNGDLVVVVLGFPNGGATVSPTASASTGYTVIQGFSQPDSGAKAGIWAWRYQVGATPPTSVQITLSHSRRASACAYRITGHNASSPINVSTTNFGTSGTVSGPSVTTTVANCLVLTAVTRVATDFTTSHYPSGWSAGHVQYAGTSGQTNELLATSAAAYKTQASSGSTGTAAWTCPQRRWVGVTLAIRP